MGEISFARSSAQARARDSDRIRTEKKDRIQTTGYHKRKELGMLRDMGSHQLRKSRMGALKGDNGQVRSSRPQKKNGGWFGGFYGPGWALSKMT